MLGATLQGWDEKNKDALPGQEMVFRNFPFFFLTLNRRRGGGGGGNNDMYCFRMRRLWLHVIFICFPWRTVSGFLLLVRLWPGGNLQ